MLLEDFHLCEIKRSVMLHSLHIWVTVILSYSLVNSAHVNFASSIKVAKLQFIQPGTQIQPMWWYFVNSQYFNPPVTNSAVKTYNRLDDMNVAEDTRVEFDTRRKGTSKDLMPWSQGILNSDWPELHSFHIWCNVHTNILKRRLTTIVQS